MTSKRTISGVVLAAGLLAGGLSQASAAPSAPSAPPSAAGQDTTWHPYRSEDLHYDAGTRCSFGVTGTVTKDREQVRNVSFWPNGEPHTQLYKGPLTMEWTNDATGASVVRNQNGRAVVELTDDGSLVSLTAMTGHFSAGLKAGSSPFTGIAIVGGRWSSVSYDASGRTVVALGPHGTIENLCDTLAS